MLSEYDGSSITRNYSEVCRIVRPFKMHRIDVGGAERSLDAEEAVRLNRTMMAKSMRSCHADLTAQRHAISALSGSANHVASSAQC